jgi:amidohydrolase
MHTSCLLGAIRILDAMKDQLSGELYFVFQPGEEKLPGGARLMLEEGIFGEGKPDLILAQHVLPELDAGKVGFREGMYMASSDEIYITVNGKGGHGALRHLLRDPILMASSILIRLQEEVNRMAPDGVPTVLSFGKVRADGATNVVPDQVDLEGTFRTMNEEWRQEAHQLITTLASEIASGQGGHCDIRIEKAYPVLHNHEALTLKSMKLAEEFLGPERVVRLEKRMTAEDFAWFTSEIPGMMYRLGVGTPGEAKKQALHTPGFRVDEQALEPGISLLVFLAAELLK